MGIEKAKIEQIDPIREYSREVLQYMYPKEGKGRKITDAIRQVLNNHFITDKVEVGRLMSAIGEDIKLHKDLKRWEKEAVPVPVGKSVEPVEKSKEPYENPFDKAASLRNEKSMISGSLFPEFEARRRAAQELEEFDRGKKDVKSKKKIQAA